MFTHVMALFSIIMITDIHSQKLTFMDLTYTFIHANQLIVQLNIRFSLQITKPMIKALLVS